MGNRAKHFLFNLEWDEILSELPKEVKYEVYDAIIEYAKSGKLLDLKPIAKGCFLFIKKELDYYKDAYDSKIEKRREAGRKGGKAKQNKQIVAKQANATFAKQNKQTQANDSINKNININKHNNVIKDFPNVKSSSVASLTDADAPRKDEDEIDFGQLAVVFNKTMIEEKSPIPKVQKITERRISMVRARCREYGKNAILQVIRAASKSSFLNGGGKQGFIATFDWIFAPNNFPKILEGNYNNQTTNNHGTTPNDRQHDGAYEERQRQFQAHIVEKLNDADAPAPDISRYL